MTMSLPKYLLCEGRLFLIRHFLFEGISTGADSTRSGTKRGKKWCVVCMPLSAPDVAFRGIWRRSRPGEPQRCPAEKIFAAFLRNKLEWVFTSDITKCTNVSLKPGVGRKATGEVTGPLMGILHCHSPLTPGNKNTLVQPT